MNTSSTKTRLSSGKGAVIVGAGLTLLALVESFLLPWSPYFPLMALIALALPLFLKTYRFGRFGEVMKKSLPLIILVWALSILWDQISSGAIQKMILDALGVLKDPVYSLPAAIDSIFAAITGRLGLSLDAAQIIFAVFVLVWAPVGEELFYRGYIYGALRQHHGFWPAALTSSLIFGIRHMLPFLILLPQLLIIPALNWGVLAFVYGIITSYLYEKTGSLFPCMIGHFLVNIVSFLLM
jgi:membrane protease YdiL (CAAX protease family)